MTNILSFLVPKSLVEFVYSTSTVRQALEKMTFHKYSAISVLDAEGRYIGTVRDSDIFAYFLSKDSFDKSSAEESSVLDIINVGATRPLPHSASMGDLIDAVKEHNSVPIVDDRGCFIGIILRRSVLDFLSKHFRES